MTTATDATTQGTDATQDTGADPGESAIDQPGLLHLDPNKLRPDPNNVRDTVENLRSLAASIRAYGVLEPLVVAPTDDGAWQIVAGHRRQAAAILAERDTVPCVPRLDLAGADAVLAALGENLRRDDLTEIEEAKGYQQALDLGYSPTRIARLTGSKPKRVKQAITVTASTAATEAMASVALTLEEAAAIAEFEDDPDAVEELLDAARDGHGSFKHTVSRLRRLREDMATRQATADALTAAGVTVIENPAYDENDTWPEATSLSRLANDDEERTLIDVDAHAACPGHAAVISSWDAERADYYCTEPMAHGHVLRWPSASAGSGRNGNNGELTEEDREARKAERRMVIANNRAWRAAEPVRREFIRGLLNRKRPPKGTLRFVTEEVMAGPDRIGDGKDSLLAELVGIDAPNGTWGRRVGSRLVAKATDVALPLVLLAQVAAARETDMDVQTWRQGQPDQQARWLQFLAGTGYTLSDIEQTVVDKVTTSDGSDSDEHLDETGNRSAGPDGNEVA